MIRVLGLDAARLEDETVRTRSLPPLPKLRVGDTVDGYTITALVADTGVHRLYQARDSRTQELVALKTLHESRAADAEERAMLAHEAWLAQRVTERDARGFVRGRPLHERDGAVHGVRLAWRPHARAAAARRSGASRWPTSSPRRSQIARALGRLHRQGVMHRDIKPGNLHLGDDGQWRVLDLGVALSGRESAAARELHAGTPSYINPEQWNGARAGCRLATCSRSASRCTAGSPAACRTARSSPTRARATGATRRLRRASGRTCRSGSIIWCSSAVAIDPKQRFETAEEMLLALRARRLAPGQRTGGHAAGRARPDGAVEDRPGHLAALQRAARLLAGVPAALTQRPIE